MSTSEAELDDLINDLVTTFPPTTTDPVKFLGEQFDRGLAWVNFPVGQGGLGLSAADQLHALRRLSLLGAPSSGRINPLGYGMVAPTIVVHGTDEQKSRYLRPLFTGEEIWCQLFSEPGAGSDVAALATRATLDGDEWILTGQKVWTTLAHISSFGLIIARTNPDVPKHKGITAFLVDMHAPGVEVLPLFQVTGEAEFNQCFFNEVRVPDRNRLGGVGEGWGVSITTLMNERVSIGGTVPPRESGLIGEAMKIWRTRWSSRSDAHAMAVRAELMEAWVRNEVGAPHQLAGERPSPSGHARVPKVQWQSLPSPRRTSALPSSASISWAPKECSTRRTTRSFARANRRWPRAICERPSCACVRTPSKAAPAR